MVPHNATKELGNVGPFSCCVTHANTSIISCQWADGNHVLLDADKALLFEKPLCVKQSPTIEFLTIQHVLLMEKKLLWNIGCLRFKVVVDLCLHLPFEVDHYL